MVLCLFFELLEDADFRLTVVFFVEAGVVLLDTALFDAVPWELAFAAGDRASPVSTDCAATGDKEPSQDRKTIPAKTATAIQRTQTLPSP